MLIPGRQCPDSYVTDRGCAYGTTGIQLRNVWERLPASPAIGDEGRRFLGFWEIDRIERRTLDGTELPAEQFAAGYLIYMPSGYMAVHLMRPDRRPYEGPRPTALEAHAAMRSYASYFGPFTVNPEEGIVVHHRAGHLDPGSIGVDAPRAFEFRDGQLILRPPVSTVDGGRCRPACSGTVSARSIPMRDRTERSVPRPFRLDVLVSSVSFHQSNEVARCRHGCSARSSSLPSSPVSWP